MELDRCSPRGSVESPTSSVRGLGSGSLPTASTDSLAADAGEWTGEGFCSSSELLADVISEYSEGTKTHF